MNYRVSQKNAPKIVWQISLASYILDSWDISIWKVGSVAPSRFQKRFCAISGSQDMDKSKLDIIIRNFIYWLIFFLEFWYLILFCLYFGSLMLYRNGVEPEIYQRKDVSPPTKLFIARKIRNKSQLYQISRYPMDSSFQILGIWYPILCCLYLGSLILCRNVFYSWQSYRSHLSNEICLSYLAYM